MCMDSLCSCSHRIQTVWFQYFVWVGQTNTHTQMNLRILFRFYVAFTIYCNANSTIFLYVQCSGCERRTRRKKKNNKRWNEHLKMNFYAYVPGLRLPMCISETIIFIERYVYISFVVYSLFIRYEHGHETKGHGIRPFFIACDLFSFEFWWNWSFNISMLQVSNILAFNAKLFLLLLIESANERNKATKILHFIIHKSTRLNSPRPHFLETKWYRARANKLNLYFIQKTIWP